MEYYSVKPFEEEDPVTIPNMQKAMAQFMLQFNSYNSKYDQVMRGEKGVKFNKKEEQGLSVFRSQMRKLSSRTFVY